MKTRTGILFLCVLAAIPAAVGVARSVNVCAHTYLSDGGAPMPPPLPMKLSAPPAGVVILADGGAPMPPPLPMKSAVVA